MVRYEGGDCKTHDELSLIPAVLGLYRIEELEEEETEEEAPDMRFPSNRAAGGRPEDLPDADQEIG